MAAGRGLTASLNSQLTNAVDSSHCSASSAEMRQWPLIDNRIGATGSPTNSIAPFSDSTTSIPGRLARLIFRTERSSNRRSDVMSSCVTAVRAREADVCSVDPRDSEDVGTQRSVHPAGRAGLLHPVRSGEPQYRD